MEFFSDLKLVLFFPLVEICFTFFGGVGECFAVILF